MKVRNLIGGFLIAAILVSSTSFAKTDESGIFDDVDYSDANYDAINHLKTEGIVQGYTDGTFKPDNKINRAEFLKIVMEASDFTASGSDCYPDVKDAWYSKYVCGATKEGLVKGYPDGYFRPEQEINFAEASKIIVNTLKIDIAAAVGDTWFENYVRALDDKYAVPKSIKAFDYEISRGDMSEMIYRVIGDPYSVQYTTYDKLEWKTAASYSESELETFDSCAELKDFVVDNSAEDYYYNYDDSYYGLEESVDLLMPAAEAPEGISESTGAVEEKSVSEGEGLGAAADDSTPEYSETNVQVKGVDEADFVKTDGEFIYVLTNGTIRVVKAYPADEMEELSSITFEDSDFSPIDMYVDEGRLVVLGYSYSQIYEARAIEEQPFHDYGYYGSITEVNIFDISDKSDIKLMREVSFEGSYTNSRKVDEMVYVVVNKTQYSYSWPEETKGDDMIPLYYDSSAEEVAPVTTCGSVLYYPAVESTDYLIVAGIPIDEPKAEVTEKVVLGASGEVYASRDNLYVAEYDYWSWWNTVDEQTVIHKFSLDREGIDYEGNGEVPGTILNQFSMDEHNGYFRIATTVGDVWDTETPSTNNLYVLSPGLELVGKLEGIAPGEKIYSVRFMGRRAYMVTFKKVDPFFVIDVADPNHPKILGKLKIPGYSDYLHPFDEDHIIGFGKEAIDASSEEVEDRDLDFAWYQGMKVAMFDVTDVENPTELHKIVIGDRGTESLLLSDHKALLFDAAKGLMAFPVTLAEIPENVKNDPGSPDNTYGDYTYQGAYVYDVSIEDGFEYRGRISHYADDEVEDLAGYYWYGVKDIQRILYIGDYLYTVSQSIVQANNMDDLEFVDKVKFEGVEDQPVYDYYDF